MKRTILGIVVWLLFGFTMQVQAQCDTVNTFPWYNDFSTNFNCWTQAGGGEWTLMNNGQYVKASVSGTAGSSTLLVSQPVSLNTGLLRLYWKERRGNSSASSNLRVSILVSTDTSFATADTVYSEMANTTNNFVPRDVSLAAYTGQTVRLAFSVQMTTSASRYMYFSDIELYSDGMPIGTLTAPGYTIVGDTTTFGVDLQQGDSSTMTFSWHSSLLDSTIATIVPIVTIAYPLMGVDTVTVTVATAYGSFTQSAVVNVVECHTIDTFPWVEPFEYNGSYNACWTVNGFAHNTPGTSFNFTDDDGQYLTFTNCLQSNGSAGCYLITPPITLPADAANIAFLLRCYNIGNAKPLRVLVSTTAATDTALFTDTIGQLVYGDNRKLRKFSLAAYAGQTIRIAIIHSHTSVLRVLYAGVENDVLPVIGDVSVPSLLSTNFPKLCTASLRFGSTDGLHYTWTSSAGGTFTSNALGDSVWVSYLYGGMTDTITVVATNLYGSDTVSRTALVVDCNPATSLPWNEDFEGGLVCWQQPEGSNWITRKWTTTYMLSLLRNKGNALCSNINQDSVYDMIVSKSITLAGTAADDIRLHWLAGTNTALFPHSYWVLITTDDPLSNSCTYDTLYSAVSYIFGTNNVWDTLSVSLADYVGQTVHIAFYSHPDGMANHGSFVDLYIDDVEIRTTALPRITLNGPTEVNSLDTVTYTAILTEGDTTGLTFSWHSSLLDSSWVVNGVNGLNGQCGLNVVYPYGGTDTVSVVAANGHGSDMATLVVTVHDCIIDSLPYSENFNGTTAVSYDAAGGKVPTCWHRYWNGSNANYAPHVINNYYQNTAIRNRVLSNPALALMAGTDEGYDSVAVVESPYFADPVGGQILSLWYMQERSDRGTLSVGYLADTGFVSVEELDGQQTGQSVTMRLNGFPPDMHRFALRWERSGIWYGVIVDNVQLIAADSVPTVHINAPATTRAFDTTLFQACLSNGDTTGLTFTWHSTLLDSTIVTTDTIITIVYPLTGVDTVSVVATNTFGSDSTWHTLTVVGEPGGLISGPTNVYTDDTNLFIGRMIYGIDSNVTFSWHSTLLDTTWVDSNFNFQFSIFNLIYPHGGVDTLTLTITNVLGSSTTTRIVNVTECHISSFPWTEGFENGVNGCWRLSANADGTTHWRIRGENYIAHSGSHYLMSPFLPSGETPSDAWFVMQPVDVPAGSNLSLNFYVDFVGNTLTHTYPRLTVLASTTGNQTSQFTDTLYTEQTYTLGDYEYVLRSLSLAPYAGQTVWIAFVHEGRQMTLHLDDISIDYASVPIVSIEGPSSVRSDDTAQFTAHLMAGDTTGVTYTWHSTLLDTSLTPNPSPIGEGSEIQLVYSISGNDTVTVIASNAYGSDTATMSCSVTNCEPIAQLPYTVCLNNTPTCWTRNGGWVVSDYFSSGISCMTVKNWAYETADSWLVTREVAVPSDPTQSYSLRWHMLCDHSIFQVLVSTQGRSQNHFTDTLYSVTTDTASWRAFSASLDAYRGQNIYIAFHNSGWYYSSVNYSDIGVIRIDTVQIQVSVASDTTHVPPAPDTVWRTLTVLCDSVMGTVSGSGIYPDSSLVTISATPAVPQDSLLRIRFDRWNDGDTSNPRQLFLVSDSLFTALFAIDTLPSPQPPDTTAISDLRLPSSIVQIYPNPAHGDVTVSVNDSRPATVSVVDFTGRVVLPPSILNSQFSILNSKLPSGVYFVRVTVADITVVKKLIIK